jgi:hypothetical protein
LLTHLNRFPSVLTKCGGKSSKLRPLFVSGCCGFVHFPPFVCLIADYTGNNGIFTSFQQGVRRRPAGSYGPVSRGFFEVFERAGSAAAAACTPVDTGEAAACKTTRFLL